MLKYYQILRNLREDNDYSQTSFAKKIGINRSTYSKYECGINDIPIPVLNLIVNKLDISIDYLFGLSKEKKYYDMKEINTKNLHIKLKNVRQKTNLSQLDVANYLDVNQNMVSYYEKGAYLIPTKKLILFCELTKTSIDYICGRTEIDNLDEKKEISV